MTRKLEFFFDIVSPASYLAWTQMPKLLEETGAEVIYRPFYLPGIFKEAGSTSPIIVPAKGKWLFADLNRFARRYGVPFVMNDRFPVNSIHVMRGLIAWQEEAELTTLADGFYQAMWVDNEDINDPIVVERRVSEAGVSPEAWQVKISDPAIKQKVYDITAEAVSRGVFGAPTFFVNDEMHWGQDRLDFVKTALLADKAA